MFKLIAITCVGLGLVLTIAGRDFSAAELAARQAGQIAAEKQARIGKPETARPAPADAPAPARAETRPELPRTTPPVRDLVIPAVLMRAAGKPAPASPAARAATQPSDAQPSDTMTYRVTGSRVNIRSGPSTEFAVMDQVFAGDIALVVEQTANGWARIRIEGDGIDGYMSARFLEPLR